MSSKIIFALIYEYPEAVKYQVNNETVVDMAKRLDYSTTVVNVLEELILKTDNELKNRIYLPIIARLHKLDNLECIDKYRWIWNNTPSLIGNKNKKYSIYIQDSSTTTVLQKELPENNNDVTTEMGEKSPPRKKVKILLSSQQRKVINRSEKVKAINLPELYLDI
jgi:hypothetical protein